MMISVMMILNFILQNENVPLVQMNPMTEPFMYKYPIMDAFNYLGLNIKYANPIYLIQTTYRITFNRDYYMR